MSVLGSKQHLACSVKVVIDWKVTLSIVSVPAQSRPRVRSAYSTYPTMAHIPPWIRPSAWKRMLPLAQRPSEWGLLGNFGCGNGPLMLDSTHAHYGVEAPTQQHRHPFGLATLTWICVAQCDRMLHPSPRTRCLPDVPQRAQELRRQDAWKRTSIEPDGGGRSAKDSAPAPPLLFPITPTEYYSSTQSPRPCRPRSGKPPPLYGNTCRCRRDRAEYGFQNQLRPPSPGRPSPCLSALGSRGAVAGRAASRGIDAISTG